MTREQGSLINSYNMLVDIAKICLVQPLSNAIVERGASTLKRIKTRLRNRMKNDMLSCLMNISINGPKLKSEDGNALIEEAARTYRSLHNRNLPPLYLPKVGGGDVQEPKAIATSDACVQTVAQVAEELPSSATLHAQQLEMLALQKLHTIACGSDSESEEESGVDSDYEFD